jgi:hypothetical protein
MHAWRGAMAMQAPARMAAASSEGTSRLRRETGSVVCRCFAFPRAARMRAMATWHARLRPRQYACATAKLAAASSSRPLSASATAAASLSRLPPP